MWVGWKKKKRRLIDPDLHLTTPFQHAGMPTLLPHEIDALRAARAAAKAGAGECVGGLEGLALE